MFLLNVLKDEWILRQRAIIYTWQQQYDLAINVYKSLLLEMSENTMYGVNWQIVYKIVMN